MRDTFTNWRTQDAGALTQTETTAGVKVGQAPIAGWPVVIHVPEQDADADTLTITWQESADNSTWRTFASTQPVVTGAPSAATSAANGLSLEERLHNNQEYVRCVLTVDGSSPDFGLVTVGMDAGKYRNALQEGAYAAP